MPAREKRTELLVGIFLFIGLVLLGGIIVQFGGFRDRLRETARFELVFTDASGLVRGAEVRLGGAKIGRVVGWQPAAQRPGERRDRAGRYFHRLQIPADSAFGIGTSGLLGDKYVDIRPPAEPTGAFLQPGSRLEGSAGAGLDQLGSTADRLSRRAESMMGEIELALADLRGLIRKIDQGLLDDENLANLKSSLAKLNTTLERLDTEIVTDENAASIKASLANFEEASASLKGTAEKLEPAADEVKPLLEDGRAAIAKVGPAAEELGATAAELRQTAAAATELLNEVGDGPGLLNALAKDAKLRGDFEALIENLRRHGILFYKDRAGREEGAEEEGGEDRRSLRHPLFPKR
ncbi:MAG: MlaD family protein [Verrucomicrobiales bacterium]